MKKTLVLTFCLIFTLIAQEKQNQQQSLIQFPISVTIGGKFIVNGTFPASMTERVDQFVTRIFNLAKENSLSIAQDLATVNEINRNLEEEYAIRGIILKNTNGGEQKIDLAKFRVNGDFVNNPYLKNDDVIIFPAVDLERNFIRIIGAVNNPGKFMFVDGDKLSDAIELAQGIDKAYDNINEAVIYRLNSSGSELDSIVVGIGEEVSLKRGDRILIPAEESKRQDYKVRVIGEVLHPGLIPITNNKTTIKDVIKMAGGFTSEADLYRSEIIRGANAFESLIFTEQSEKLQMARMSTLIENDSLYFQIDEKLRFLRGNGLVDFTKLSDDNYDDGKFVVQNFDVIYVPAKINLIYVYGQVNKAGYVNYAPDQNYEYYLNKAGGIGETALDVYIIKGQSRSWVSAEDYPNTTIEPGDYIWVSKQTPRTFWYHIEQAARITAIIGSVATVLLLFK
ncbi:MAG: SLBB domain-containing protein [Ignavibacterium sp.]|jgi:protein involved in polysaccharide export with SLBB domain|nr:SLBB domain-containing protein [Ignavibacterium sp.]